MTVNEVICAGPTSTDRSVEFIVSGVFHGMDPLTYLVQIISPSGDVIRSAEITIPGNAPDPSYYIYWTTFIGMSFEGEPGTYQIVATPVATQLPDITVSSFRLFE